MSMQQHLIQSLQQYFGFPELKKIDPNTQEVSEKGPAVQQLKFGQAMVPSVIIGVERFVHSELGWRTFLSGENYPNWGSRIFGRNNAELCKRIAEYSDMRSEEVMHKMHEMVERAVWMIRNSGMKSDADTKQFIEKEKNIALLYLPAKLKLGEMLGDDSIDDRTHKMEGPISNMMKSLGHSFDSPEVKNANEPLRP
jgi:hypothetical protein